MEKLYNQIQTYLNMDEEIGFKEFQTYYRDVISYLDQKAENLNEDGLWKALFVVESVMSNAENRGVSSKKPEQKKYKKMANRTKIYAQHFTKRLNDLGYNEEQIGQKFEKMLEEGSKEEADQLN